MKRLATLPFLLLFSVPALAQRLPHTGDPEQYDLKFAVDLPHARFEGTEVIRVRLSQPTSRIVLNAAELAFRNVTIDSGGTSQQAAVTLERRNETATLTVMRPLAAGTADIHVAYTGTLNNQLRGFYLSKSSSRDYAVTQFESTDARRAFPCFDEPAYKATFAVALTIDRSDMAISNGRVTSDTPGPGPGQHTLTFSTTPRMSSYLVAMAVGDFQCLEGAVDRVPIRICATPDKKNLGRIALESAQEILKFYNRYYAVAYPFGKLDILAVPDFAAGAMENTAAIFFRETDLLADSDAASVDTRKNIASGLAHEMAHQWFGDLVTMRWWDDIWLNEGFATWMANRPLEAWKPEWNIPVDEELETQKALNLDALRSTHAIRSAVSTPTEIDAAFDPISYEKGAAVLRMIEHYVGADTFRTGINAYLQAHAYANATSEDFWNAIAAASGKPVDRILPTFITQVGAPLVDVSRLTCSGSPTVSTRATFTQERFGNDASVRGKAGWQVPACIKVGGTAEPAEACPVLPPQPRALDVAHGCAPWIFANAGAQGYYRTAYPPALLRGLAPDLSTALTAPERLSLIADEWAMVSSGRHTAADYLTLASGFGRESSSGVLADVVDRLALILQYLTTDASGPRFEAFARGMLRPLFDRLGLSAVPSDPDGRRALRAVVVGALGTTGNDPDIVAQARAALDRSLAGGPTLDPTLAPSLVSIAAAHGDAALYDSLLAAAARAGSPGERSLYLDAAADFRDPAVLTRALQRALTPEVRTQDTALYLAPFFNNPVARPLAWAFVKANWTTLAPKMSVFGGDVALMDGLASFCEAGAREDIKTFFATHKLSDSARPLTQTLERITSCMDLKARQTGVVSGWLANQ